MPHDPELDALVGTVQSRAKDLLLVLVSFDGVLADYQDDPSAVRLSPERRERLVALMRQPDVAVAITSGRPVADLIQRTGLGDRAFYVGLHGLEIVGPGFSHVQRETIDQHRTHVREIASAVERSMGGVAGARIENKEGAIALHTRRAGPADAVWARLHLLNRAADLVNAGELRVYRGNHVLELLPNHRRLKADAIARIQEFLRCENRRDVFTVYVAEDLTDDDGLDAVKDDGVAAVVGRRGRSDHLRLQSPEAVEQLVTELAEVRAATRTVPRPTY